jgi:D-alanyl-D-alanine carboxypeptidase/D-alanyl-D-alanine-endopeptidase (penicillin-binding protein 4)
LFTTALALLRLGPDYRFRTVVMAAQAPDAAGRVAGEVRLVGGGDPSLSGRVIPYQKDAPAGDPLVRIEALAEQVVARGVRRIEGAVVGDDTAYLWEPYPQGWSQDDAVWEYGAPVSALTLNDNAITLSIRPPARAGQPPELTLTPALDYYVIDNRIQARPGAERRIRLERLPGSRQLRLWGSLSTEGSGATRLALAVDDPALYAATAFYEALLKRGVAITGGPRAHHRFANEVVDLKNGGAPTQPAGGFELARLESPPLVELLRVVDKVSQNLHAELMLREVARARRQIGTREAGLEELRQLLAEAGLEEASYLFADGSGLSRQNLVAPAAVVKLLRHLDRSPHREAWVTLLPIGGEDGTLANRFDGNPEGRRVRAKTGTLSHVSALSGYIESRSRGRLAFSLMVNNYRAPSSEIRGVVDKVCLLLAQ